MVYPLPKKSAKNDFILNMFGSSTVSFVSVILLIVVSHFAGEESAGIFSLCYSTGQMLYTIAAFELRTIQVTERNERFGFGDMLGFRLLTAAFMLLFSVGFLLVRGFSGIKLTVALLIVLYMAVLSLSDVFQGSMHKNGFLALAGFSNGTGILLAAVSFAATLAISKNLVVAAIPMAVTMLAWVLLFDMPFARNFSSLKPRFDFKNIKTLLWATLPLVISVFMNQYNLNSPKYAIDRYLSEIDQSHYGYLVMPAFVINLLSIFVFRPQIVTLSERWNNNNLRGFKKIVLLLFGWIVLAAAVVIGGAWLWGIPILNLLYHTDLTGMRLYLLLLIVGGTFSAGSSLTLMLLSVMRKQKLCLFAYGAAFVLALFVPELLVKYWDFFGAVLSYISVTLSLFIGIMTVFLISYGSKKRQLQKKT